MALAPAEKGHSPFPSSERAIYGFALYLASYVVLVVFTLWALLPDTWLHSIGFTYFPQKYWAVAVPAYACIGIWAFFLLYCGANCLLVPSLSDPRTVQDPSSPPPPPPDRLTKTSIPPLYDIPISTVNRAMFPPPNSRHSQQHC